MQQANQAFALSAAAVRRSNRLLLLLTCLPLLTACTVLAGVRGIERVSQARTRAADRRLGNLKQSQAVALARTLCTRVAGAPAEVLDASGHQTPMEADTDRQWNEWQVECRAGAGRYLLRLDANRQEVLLILREHQAGPAAPRTESASGKASANGDLPANRLSDRESTLWARRYLSVVGLPLPADARLVRNTGGYDFVYQCRGGATSAAGQRRMLRVRIDPRDGSLVYLENVLYRKTPRKPTSLGHFIAAVEPLASSQP